MRFRLIDAAKKDFPIQRLCKVLDDAVRADTSPGRSARPAADSVTIWCCWLMSARPSPFRTGPTAARAWCTNFATMGLPSRAAGRVARLMRENGLRARQKRRFKRTTDGPSRLSDRPEPSGPGLRSGRAEPEVGRRHLLRVDPRGLALPRRRHRPVRPARRRLGNQRLGFTRNWHCRLCAGPSPCGVRSPASFTTRTAAANTAPSITRAELEEERHPDFDVGKGKLLR